MGDRVPAHQEPDERDQSVDPGSGQEPRARSQQTPRQDLNIGPIFARTVRHFFPDLNSWIDEIDDPRFQPYVTYSKHFLLWVGIMLFVCKLGSRRQIDFLFASDGPQVLPNLNRLAGAKQDSHPVNKTLEHFVRGIGPAPISGLCQQMVNRLIRMKALEDARLQGRYLVLIDGTGVLTFHERHCEHCLTQKHGEQTIYLHQVLEAKLLGPCGTVFSLATEFIDNRDAKDTPAGASAEKIKQDCELKALPRLLAKVRATWPNLRICLVGDSLFACGAGLQAAKDHNCDFIYVFKENRTPALWKDFQGLLSLCPDQRVEVETPDKTKQCYRWVNKLDYEDSDNRKWKLNALLCTETKADGEEVQWAWWTGLTLGHKTAPEVGTKGGRERWREENEGFNTQKNSGLNLEHAYSHKQWEAYYFLLQIAHMMLQLLEKGSLLRQLAREQGKKSAVASFGSLKNMAKKLLESLRQRHWPEAAFDAAAAARIQIRLDSS